jgi:Plasmid maintenance system killer protein
MIKTFKHKGLEKFYYTGSLKGIQPHQADKLERILDKLDAATAIIDMNISGFKLHPLLGRKNVWSVWVNGNWRVTFLFDKGDAYIVNYEDYH